VVVVAPVLSATRSWVFSQRENFAFRPAALAAANGADMLMRNGFAFPLLLRAPGIYMGEHVVRVESACDLAPAVAELPGADGPEAELLAIDYLDAQALMEVRGSIA
jgi:hypothetical protein